MGQKMHYPQLKKSEVNPRERFQKDITDRADEWKKLPKNKKLL